MTRYLNMLSVQSPIELDKDKNERVLRTVNINALAASPVTDWLREIEKILVDAAIVTAGTVLLGPVASAPTGDGPYVRLINTGGTAPSETHQGDKYERMSAQIRVRAKDYDAGKALADAIWRELDGNYNFTVVA